MVRYSRSKNPRLNLSKENVSKQLEYIKDICGKISVLHKPERLTILNVLFISSSERSGRKRKQLKTWPSSILWKDTSTNWTGKRTIQEIVKNWTNAQSDRPQQELAVREPERGNKNEWTRKIPLETSILYQVRDFVIGKRIHRQIINAKEVLEFLVEKGIVIENKSWWTNSPQNVLICINICSTIPG